MEYEMFVKKVDEFCELIKTSPKRAGVDTLFFPGEIEFNTWNQRTKEGIPVSLNILRELNELASNIGVKERLE
jgi:LDH2 family malate/lactate/ureidoglycolate dehydrogenase